MASRQNSSSHLPGGRFTRQENVASGKYCAVPHAPAPGVVKQTCQTESPQLKTIRYRGNYTPGIDSTYADGSEAIAEAGAGREDD
jgi:hypothetical protein